jgi:hypothetical protein
MSNAFALTAPRQPFAVFSPCKRYRYLLGWPAKEGGHGVALFVLANPSTATAEQTDPTVARCIAYATRWGYEWCHVVNVRAWRETDPDKLPADPEAIGPENDEAIRDAVRQATIVVCGWGKLGGDRGLAALRIIREVGGSPLALKLNLDGSPAHPLYQRSAARPFPVPGAA